MISDFMLICFCACVSVVESGPVKLPAEQGEIRVETSPGEIRVKSGQIHLSGN